MKEIMDLKARVLKQAKQIISDRVGEGPWLVWFPGKSPEKQSRVYMSGPIKVRSELQALGSWLAADTEGRNWHNTIFKDYKRVVYQGREFSKDEGKLLFHLLKKNKDWDAVDLSDSGKKVDVPEIVKKVIKREKFKDVNQLKLDL